MASANPATSPLASAAPLSATPNTVPLVPSETTTSPALELQPERGGHVVAGARRDEHAVRGVPGDVGRAEHGRQLRRPAAEGVAQDVEPVGVVGRREVAGAGRVAAVGDRVAAGELPGQPVVREQHARDAVGELGLVVGQPAQLRDGEAGDRHRTDGLGPDGRAAELVDEVERRLRGAGVVPQQRGPDDVVVLVEGDHAVLLTADADGLDVVEQALRGLAEGVPPGGGVDLGALRVRRAAGADDLAGFARRTRRPWSTAWTSRCRRPAQLS